MILDKTFFMRDCLEVAPDLVGKVIVRIFENGDIIKLRITETEAYRGEEDKACHASKGRTKKSELMYEESGTIYVYLCYGIHWLVNIITGEKDNPQGVLIRACEGYNGPAKLTKYLEIDRAFNGLNICGNSFLKIENDNFLCDIKTDKRVGIDYAGDEWRDKPWRYILKNKT